MKAIGMILPAVLLFFAACNGNRDPWTMAVPESMGLPINNRSFEPGKLENLALQKTILVPAYQRPVLLSGDLTGDRDAEVVVADTHGITLVDKTGEILAQKELEGLTLYPGFCADIDGDGKDDLVAGVKGGKNARIVAFNGFLDIILDQAFENTYDAQTKAHFFDGERILFSCFSSLTIPPKFVGAYNLRTETLDWTYFTGPLPLSVSTNGSGDLLSISNMGRTNLGLILDDRNRSDHSKFRASLYLLKNDGSVLLQESLGPESRHSYFVENGISDITTRLFDMDGDGIDELVVAVNRRSEMEMGRSEIQIRNQRGAILKQRSLEAATALQITPFTYDQQTLLSVVSRNTGAVRILDADLEIKAEHHLPAGSGPVVLREMGDYNGDGAPEFLLSAGHRVYILDINLEERFSSALNGEIRGVLASESAGPQIWVLAADGLHRFGPADERYGTLEIYTEPPGAEAYLDGLALKGADLPVLHRMKAGEHTVKARLSGFSSEDTTVQVEAGKLHTLSIAVSGYSEEPLTDTDLQVVFLESRVPGKPLQQWADLQPVTRIPLPEDYRQSSVQLGDFIGDDNKEFMLISADNTAFYLMDHAGALLKEQSITGLDVGFHMFSVSRQDLNQDGKQELLLGTNDPIAFQVLSADGRTLFYKEFGHWYNCVISGYTSLDDTILMMTASGYLMSPRGIMAVEYPSGPIRWSYPTPSPSSSPLPLVVNDRIYLAQYTTSNGMTIEYPTGLSANDSQYFIHVVNSDGSQSDRSFTPLQEENNGSMVVANLDLDENGTQEIYYFESKTAGYYLGSAKIHRLDEENRKLIPLHIGLQDTRIHPHSIAHSGDQRYLICAYNIPVFDVLTDSFTFVRRIDLSEYYAGSATIVPGSMDLDGNGESELYVHTDNAVVILDLQGRVIHTLTIPHEEETIRRIFHDDYNNDGTYEIYIRTQNHIQIYSY